MAVGQKDQDRALAAALSDSLWLAGQEESATVTLVTEDYCITPHLDYKLDNFTEKVPHSSMENRHTFLPVTSNHLTVFQLQLFTFNKEEDVRSFILDHIQCVSGRFQDLKERPRPTSDDDSCLCCSSKTKAVMESSSSSTASSAPAQSTGTFT